MRVGITLGLVFLAACMPVSGKRQIAGGAESATGLFKNWEKNDLQMDLSYGDRSSNPFSVVFRGHNGTTQYACDCDGTLRSGEINFYCPFPGCGLSGDYSYSIEGSVLKLCQSGRCQEYR